MTLIELRISTYLYTRFTGYDKKYKGISDKLFDLTKKNDQDVILQFLRNWGCRQFKIENNTESAKELSKWYKKHHSSLSKIKWNLVDATNEDIMKCETLFQDLMDTFASSKRKGKQDFNSFETTEHTVGPVGAAKLLFAIKKNSFAPWDNPIINKLKFTKNGKGYCNYLLYLRQELYALKAECESKGIDFNNLPLILEQPYASLPKLIDEHLWVSITRRCNPKEIIGLTKTRNK